MEIRLREAVPEDVDALHRWQTQAKGRHMAAFGTSRTDDRSAFEIHWLNQFKNPDNSVLIVLADGVEVGFVVTYLVDDDREIGYWIDEAWWGKGIATRASELLLEEITQRPLFASIAGDNKGSARVLEKLGFYRIDEQLSFAPARGEKILEFIYRLD